MCRYYNYIAYIVDKMALSILKVRLLCPVCRLGYSTFSTDKDTLLSLFIRLSVDKRILPNLQLCSGYMTN